MAEWQGVVNTTMHKFFKGAVDALMRNFKLFAMLNDRGLITYNMSGDLFDWKVKYLQNSMIGFDDSDTLVFSDINRHKTAQLPWRGYSMAEGYKERDRLMNSGMEAIVKVFSTKAEDIMEDIEEQIGYEFYVDGNAAGNGKKFHGIESFMGVSGTVAGSPVGSPHSNYANINTDLGGYGGTWGATAWPAGTGSATYDFWAPMIVDYTNVLWPQATKTWDNTCIDAMRYGLQKVRRNKSKSKQVDCVIHEGELYRKFVTLLQTEERLNVSPQNGSSGLWKLGFTDVTNFDGVDITWEYGITNPYGYGWCMNDVELLCLGEDFIKTGKPDWDVASQSWRFATIILANLKFKSLRNFVSWKNIS